VRIPFPVRGARGRSGRSRARGSSRRGLRAGAIWLLVTLSLPWTAIAAASGPASGQTVSPPPVEQQQQQDPAGATERSERPGGREGRAAAAIEEAVELVEEQPGRLWERFLAVWNYDLGASDDHPVTIGMLIGALIVFLLGGIVARITSRWLGRRLLPRFGLERGAAATFQTLTFYALLVVFGVYAMQWAGIPLTVFTIAGGALAIGVGFGSQNIVNNFISGLILMAERPIKVGDLVDVEGTQGIVERIGARSTRVLSGDNTHIIIPNSSFLEKRVVNWTLSDRSIRTFVDVGVAYGSPTSRVRDLMLEAIGAQPDVARVPAPEVMFWEFGDSALVFRGFFWIRIERPLGRYRVQSELRYRIDELFREAGITIAFPQRDVHLESLRPLEVRLLDREPPHDAQRD
jgi:small-conductance mechanosensitive channel